jgi:hypothetical protein
MANRMKPEAATMGPMVNGRRAPKRVIRPPAHRDIRNVMTTKGTNALPAAVAE